jgi:hypothetical protein
MEEAWSRHYKFSAAGSWHAACKYTASDWVPPTLVDFAEGGRYHKVDPPLKLMSGGDFDKWQSAWEQECAWKAAWEGSSSGGAPRAANEKEEGNLRALIRYPAREPDTDLYWYSFPAYIPTNSFSNQQQK